MNKADKWSKHLMKQAMSCQAYKIAVDTHDKLPGETKTEYKQRFANAETAMRKMANDLAAVTDPEKAAEILPGAPVPSSSTKMFARHGRKLSRPMLCETPVQRWP